MILNDIHSPEDLKLVPKKLLPLLAKEIRSKIIEVVGHNGGHLASNLGVVELSIALHRSFSSPQDAIIWDVSHQCYPHKILTGRYGLFSSIRMKDGISGFTKIRESPHDYFDAGHASSSISSALGLLSAWELQGRNDKVVVVIGDGALTGGMAFEGLSHAGQLAKNLIVVVNDNQMSIDKNVGSISRYLSKLAFSTSYHGFRYKVDRLIDRIPYFNRCLGKLVFRLKRGLKGVFFTNNLFVDLGFEYTGPMNGHNIDEMERVFSRAKKIPYPVVIHVVTKKGKGYSPAENDPSVFHGVGPFNISDGLVEKFDTLSFTENFSNKMIDMAEKNPRIIAVTAAMSKGTGLDAFSRKFKSRFFDVGIAEEHAVTFAGGLAAGGLVPVVAIYSTFIQRSVDQIIEDIALQNRHVVIALDRAGAVPSDGETHQGIFDIALFRPVPNLCIISVAGKSDMDCCLDWAVNSADCPVVIRWPKMTCPSELEPFSAPVEPGKGILVTNSDFAPSISSFGQEENSWKRKILLVCTGSMFSETLTASRALVMDGIDADIYSLRFIKPFDIKYFISIAKLYSGIVLVEDGVRLGGISEWIENCIRQSAETSFLKTAVLAFPDSFVANGNREQILEEAGLSPEKIRQTARELIRL
ncbi:1-deoxy-D-xylulose-5-phosphate synthase [Treponema sp.]|uniref:1-deoxy-D-xylulose-5-phosphate synthase n=1 Tax=Treponema sp. TaxID=166 RepID=UPI003F053A93